MLIFREPIQGSTSYTRLQIVSRGLYDIIFIAFHSNPIGGHLNAYRTFHQLHLRYHWALISIVVFARHSPLLSTCPCYQRICHTIAAHVWSRLHLLKSRTPIPITASLFSLKCWRRIAMACPTCRSTRLHLASLALSPIGQPCVDPSRISVLCATGVALQLDCLLLWRWSFCVHHINALPSILCEACLRSVQLRSRSLPGIHSVHAHLRTWEGSTKSHPLLWRLLSNTWLPHPFSLVLGQ